MPCDGKDMTLPSVRPTRVVQVGSGEENIEVSNLQGQIHPDRFSDCDSNWQSLKVWFYSST